MIETHTVIPLAADIDYTNVDAICGYQMLLCKIFEGAGGFVHPAVTNATIHAVRQQGLLWLKDVRTLIADILSAPVCGKSALVGMESAEFEAQSAPCITLAAIPDLLDSYDLLYRVCNGDPCYDYLREVKLKTVNRWLRGDKAISDIDVALLLLSETDRDIRSLEKRYTDYAFSILGKWIDELTRYGRFINTPLAEAYKRLVYLLNDDLFAYLGRKDKQEAAKTAWAKAYIVEDPRTLDTPALRAYIPFARTLAHLRRTPFEDSEAEYETLAAELASRPDLHPFYRQILRLSIDTRKCLLAVCYPEETA